MALAACAVVDLVNSAKHKADHPNQNAGHQHSASASSRGSTAESAEHTNVAAFHSPMPTAGPSAERENHAGMEELPAAANQSQEWEEHTSLPPPPSDWTVKQRIFVLLEEESAALLYPKMQPPLIAKIVSHVLLYTIVASIACFVLETDSLLRDFWLWKIAEPVTTVIFTIEYVGRFLVCDAFGTQTKWGFVKAPMNVLDLLAILPYYFEVAAEELMKSFKPLRVLRSVRLIRCFRILKLSKYNSGMQMMIESLINSLQPLSILIFFLCIGVILFSSLMYFAERMDCPDVAAMIADGTFRKYQDDCDMLQSGWDSNGDLCCNKYGSSQEFESIASTCWWSIVTMTTVGYGDRSPRTFKGRLVGAAAMLSGIILISLPVAIVGSKFQQAYESQEERKAQEALKAEEDRELEERMAQIGSRKSGKFRDGAEKVLNVAKAEISMKKMVLEKQHTLEMKKAKAKAAAEEVDSERPKSQDSEVKDRKEKLQDGKKMEAMIHFEGIRERLKKMSQADLSHRAFDQVELLLELFDHIERVEMQLSALRKKDTVLDNCIRKEFVALSRAYDNHMRAAPK